LKVGDAIISINSVPVFSLASAAAVIRTANNPMQLQLVVRRSTGSSVQSGGLVRVLVHARSGCSRRVNKWKCCSSTTKVSPWAFTSTTTSW
jgi:hypothetical protein